MTALLEATGLGKRFRSTWALRGCDLSLPAGRVIALVGPNGAGKTTFLRLATGLLDPTEGSIAVFGARASADSADALARVGFVAQDYPLYHRFRIRELLRMGRSLNLHWDQELAESRITALGIPLDRRSGQLSGGQQAQVALALALAKHPLLLVLDEPVASLDPLARREFMQTLMTAVADDGITVLLSSHNVAELERVCDYLIVITGGRVRLAGEIEDLLADHRVLTGPASPAVADAPGVIHGTHGDRHANLVVRTGRAPVMPGWQSHPIGLEELVLAYLHRAQADPRSTRSGTAEAVRG